MTSIINGRLILPDDDGKFKVFAGKVLNFGEKICSIGDFIDGEPFDAQNNFVAPGFINIHIHGCAGADTMDENPNSLTIMREFLPISGITSFLPTTMTMSLEKISSALEKIRREQKISHGAKILGAHLEGPFISKKFNGAQDAKYILPADFAFVDKFSDVIKIITVAPEEIPLDFIDFCRERGIIVSIGHSSATFEVATAAIARGAKHVTHLFNAQSPFHHRKPGIVGAALNSDAIVEIIADNVHVHPVAQRFAQKIKPQNQIVLITDSIRACGLGDGESELGGQKVFVNGNFATLADGTLVGSVATLNNVLKNFCENTNLDVAAGIELVTKNPAVELGIFDRFGSLEVGKSADIVIFDAEFNILETFIDGSASRQKSRPYS